MDVRPAQLEGEVPQPRLRGQREDGGEPGPGGVPADPRLLHTQHALQRALL